MRIATLAAWFRVLIGHRKGRGRRRRRKLPRTQDLSPHLKRDIGLWDR